MRIEMLLYVRVVGKKRQQAVSHDDRLITNRKEPNRLTLVCHDNRTFLVRLSWRGEFLKLFYQMEIVQRPITSLAVFFAWL